MWKESRSRSFSCFPHSRSSLTAHVLSRFVFVRRLRRSFSPSAHSAHSASPAISELSNDEIQNDNGTLAEKQNPTIKIRQKYFFFVPALAAFIRSLGLPFSAVRRPFRSDAARLILALRTRTPNRMDEQCITIKHFRIVSLFHCPLLDLSLSFALKRTYLSISKSNGSESSAPGATSGRVARPAETQRREPEKNLIWWNLL